jgi:hypothetical protein
MAVAQIHLHELEQHDAGLLSDEDKAAMLKDAAVAGQQLRDNGVDPVFTGSEADADANLSARMQVNQSNPVGVVKLPNADGTFSVFEIPNNSKPYDHPVTLTIGYNDGPDGDGQPIPKRYEAGQISIAQGLAIESAAWADHMRFLRGESTAAQKADAAQTLQGMKGNSAERVAQIRAQAMSGTLSVDAAAAMLLSGNLNPADLSKRGNYNVNVIARANQMAGGQGFNAVAAENSAAAAKATEKAFTSGSQGQQLTAIATARQHMAVFKQTAQALDNGDAGGAALGAAPELAGGLKDFWGSLDGQQIQSELQDGIKSSLSDAADEAGVKPADSNVRNSAKAAGDAVLGKSKGLYGEIDAATDGQLTNIQRGSRGRVRPGEGQRGRRECRRRCAEQLQAESGTVRPRRTSEGVHVRQRAASSRERGPQETRTAAAKARGQWPPAGSSR